MNLVNPQQICCTDDAKRFVIRRVPTRIDYVLCLVMAVEESEKIVQVTLNEFDNPKNCGTTCTAGIVRRMYQLTCCSTSIKMVYTFIHFRIFGRKDV